MAVGDVTFQREGIAGLWAELLPLFVAHHEANDGPLRDVPLDIDQGLYERMDGAGGYRCFTARAEGALIGYAGYFVGPHPHHCSITCASHDVLFVAPSHREGATALRLMGYATGELIREDVHTVTQEAHAGSAFETILRRLHYVPSITVFNKRL